MESEMSYAAEEVLIFDFWEQLEFKHGKFAFATAVAYFPAMMNVKCFEKFCKPFKKSEEENRQALPKSGGSHLASYAYDML